MRRGTTYTAFGLIAWAAAVHGQTPRIISPVYNAASYGTVVAPGSIVTVRGENLGPTNLVQATGDPLPTTLAGTTVEVVTNAGAMPAAILHTSANQVAVLLPPNAPVGEATVTVSYNDRQSSGRRFSIAPVSFGTFTTSATGRGPAALQNVSSTGDLQLNTLINPAHPNGAVVLYGTGLGESTPEIYVGGRPATLLYAGRSGCCAGLDQINFVIPDGVTGCYVPVLVKTGSALSNSATLSIAPPQDDVCSDEHGRTADQLRAARDTGQLTESRIVLRRLLATEQFGLIAVPVRAETGFAVFEKYPLADLLRSTGFTAFGPPVTPGSCVTYAWGQHVFEGIAPDPVDVVRPQMLDAGPSLTLTGPGGARTLRRTDRGDYSSELSSAEGMQRVPYFQPGTLAYANGAGGADIGGFTAQVTMPAAARWTNEATTSVILRAAGYEATWTGADPNGFAYVTGRTGSAPGGTAFTCFQRADAGRLFVPAYILESVPNLSQIGVGLATQSNRFTAPGMGAGTLVFIDYREKPVLVR